MNKTKRKLKSRQFFKRAAIVGSTLAFAGGLVFGPMGCTYAPEATQTETQPEEVKLSSNESVDALAKMYGVSDYLCRSEADNSYVRFEPLPDTTIKVIVDEDSVWCMTDENKQRIF